MEPYSSRRQRLAESVRARGGGLVIVHTAPEAIRNRDSHYPYRWDSYFYYLTGFTEPEATLVMRVDQTGHESILFCRPKDEEREIWDGYRHGPDQACSRFSFDRAMTCDRLDAEIPKLMADQPALFTQVSGPHDGSTSRWIDAVRAQARTGVAAPEAVWDVRKLIDEMRLIKDDHEAEIMRRAARISAAAHVRAMKACKPGMFEFQVEAELLHEFTRSGSQSPAYGSIVASGRHACVLHYRSNDAQMRDGDLLLIDAGCELDGYASDITRTFPINGRFTGAQRLLYDIVLDAQLAAVAATRAGAHFTDPHDAAVRVLTQGMIDCGLIGGSLDHAIETGAYRRFYMHRTSHWLGMDVHDCGDYREPGAPQAAGPARPWRILREGMVLTIEPGIYVRASDDVPEHFHDIGIRIEDDALVTKDGCEILTADVPKAADEIEALMRG
jgi:Xaa-Pro aminopeptidase